MNEVGAQNKPKRPLTIALAEILGGFVAFVLSGVIGNATGMIFLGLVGFILILLGLAALGTHTSEPKNPEVSEQKNFAVMNQAMNPKVSNLLMIISLVAFAAGMAFYFMLPQTNAYGDSSPTGGYIADIFLIGSFIAALKSLRGFSQATRMIIIVWIGILVLALLYVTPLKLG